MLTTVSFAIQTRAAQVQRVNQTRHGSWFTPGHGSATKQAAPVHQRSGRALTGPSAIMSKAEPSGGGQQAGAPSPAPPAIAVISTLGCPYCKRTKAALSEAGVAYEDLDLTEQPELLVQVKSLTGQSTVPQVFVGGRLLGGSTETLAALQDGSLQAQLRKAEAASQAALPQSLREAVDTVLLTPATAAAAEEEDGSKERQQLATLAAALAAAGQAGGSKALTLHAAQQWLQGNRGLAPAAALEQLSALQAAQLLTVASSRASDSGSTSRGDVALTAELAARQPDLPLQLVADLPLPSLLSQPLNSHFRWFGPARPASQVAEGLRRQMVALYDRHITTDGRKVDYRALRSDPGFRRFVDSTAELQQVDLSAMRRAELMSFFINLYNSLILHAITVLGPAEDNTLSRLRWFDGISYIIGGLRFSSNDMEHGVLRGNAPSPASLGALLGLPRWLAGHTFKSGDPRAALALQPVDPRIHFALNCGAASCPPIRVYTPDRLEFGLDSAARAFCQSEVAVDPASGEVTVSMILKWYAGDFGSKEELLHFLVEHTAGNTQAALKSVIAKSGGADKVRLKYRPYDWATNATE